MTSLNLSGNKLATIKDLAPLASLENLTHLELSDCELVSLDNYRKEVFALLPNLMFLDGLDQNGVEESEMRALGEGLNGSKNGTERTSRPAEDDEEQEDDEEDEGDESEEEEELGLSALQGSKELESDEEDYVPGEEEDEPEVEDEDEESEDSYIEEELKNLSDAGVTDNRRAQKRSAEDEGEGASEAKIPATEDSQ